MSIQTKETIELSRQGGIKITYLRFLADSAPGFLFILSSTYYYLNNQYDVIFPFNSIDNNNVQLGLLILLFFLATPLGLAINAISWILLGKFEVGIAKFLMNLGPEISFLAGPSRLEYPFDKFCDVFNSKKHKDNLKLYEYSKQYEILLSSYFPASLYEIGHISGLAQFTRSVAFIVLCFAIVFFLTELSLHTKTECNSSTFDYSLAFIIASPILFISLHLFVSSIFERFCEIPGKASYWPNIFFFLRLFFTFIFFAFILWLNLQLTTASSEILKVFFIFLSLFFLFIFTAGFLNFYTAVKVLAYTNALVDPDHHWKSDKVEDRLKEIASYIVKEGRKN